MKFKNTFFVATLLLIMPLIALGNTMGRKEFVKTINKVFDIDRTGSVAISNRHGKVDIKVWNKPVVQVDVKIIVQAKDEDKAEAVFDRISIQFQNEDAFVKAMTDIESKKKGWSSWNVWNGDSDRDDFEINYEVFIPKEARLEVINKYGDTFIAETDGPVNADIGYGSVRFEGVNNELKLYLGYGDATIIRAKELTGEIKYSKMNLRSAVDSDLRTKYSKIQIDDVQSMRTITKYDEYNINNVNSLRTEGNYGKFIINNIGKLVADGKYTDFMISSLTQEADVVLSYGGFKIESLKKGFSAVRLDGSYANFKINTTPDISYKIDANASYGDISLPENIETTYNRDSGYSNRIEGVVGKGSPTSYIKVKVNYGDIKIR